MNLFKLTVGDFGRRGKNPDALVDFRFGGLMDPEDALVRLDLGDTSGSPPSRSVTVGLGSLLCGTAGVLAANVVAGWLTGSIGSSADILLNHLDAQGEAIGAKSIFASCFLTGATVSEIGRRLFRNRKERFMDAASGWDAVAASTNGDGRWVVGPAGLFDGEAAHWTVDALALWGRNKVAVLNEAEYARFERRVAEHGSVLTKYQMDGERRGTVTTLRSGRLHSVGANPAYKVMKEGVVTAQEWYRDGIPIPMPTTGELPSADADRPVAAELRQALELMHRAREIVRTSDMSDRRQAMFEARAMLVAADSVLGERLGDGFQGLRLDIDNVDGLIEWPEETARRFVSGAGRFLEHSMSRVDAKLIEAETPAVAAFASAVKRGLRDHEADDYEVSLGRFTEMQSIPMVTVSRIDDEEPVAQIVWGEDAWFGEPGVGEVVGRAIAWKPSLSPEKVVETVMASRFATPSL